MKVSRSIIIAATLSGVVLITAFLAQLASIEKAEPQKPRSRQKARRGLTRAAQAVRVVPESKDDQLPPGSLVVPLELGNGHTTMKLHPSARGYAVKLEKEIATRLAKDDPRPPKRLARFQHLVNENVACVGWSGSLLEATPNGTGWQIKVRMTPKLVSSSGIVIVSDCVDETYQYSGGALRYLGEEVPEDVMPGMVHTL